MRAGRHAPSLIFEKQCLASGTRTRTCSKVLQFQNRFERTTRYKGFSDRVGKRRIGHRQIIIATVYTPTFALYRGLDQFLLCTSLEDLKGGKLSPISFEDPTSALFFLRAVIDDSGK